MRDDGLLNFGKQVENERVEVPPNPISRRFNECDIFGALDRDAKGNVIVGAEDAVTGTFVDKAGRHTNQRGYLVDEAGNVINNLNGQIMFAREALDDRGEVPAPFSLEKYGFNPHLVRGHFDFDSKGRPTIRPDPTQAGKYLDKKGASVSKRGYRVDEHGNVVDNVSRMTFHRTQLGGDGDLPKMFTYSGRRFDIVDCIGTLNKDSRGMYVFARQDKKGNLHDLFGRLVNSKGYLIDNQGNVVNRDGLVLFERRHLLSNEIPKIFSFTRFSIDSILGHFEMDPLGVPVLNKSNQGCIVDQEGRTVSAKGYLINEDGNIIDSKGHLVFRKEQL